MKCTSGNIAVTGISGIFPGANDMEKFTANIMAGHEAIIDVPEERWIIHPDCMIKELYQSDAVSSKRAGLVGDFPFDPKGFILDPDLLSSLEPLHRMVLHAGREALSTCFHTPKIREKTGVILAAISLPTQATSEISHRIIMGDTNGIKRSDALSCGVVSVPAALLARAMGLKGGSYTLDAACASSLFAIKLACERLNSGKADMMVAGGVSRPDSLYTQVGFTQLKALSPTGRCAPFDKNADGLVVGEGTGILVLKRLDDAVAAGDRIWGVIKGAGWSNDIEGNLVAPASEGQVRAMAAAYQNAGWLPGDIQHLECHGSATPVGDNIELNSMKKLWQKAGCANAPCAIGSIKSMTGHLLTAAGAAGMIKTLVAMDKKLLPPSLNFTEPAKESPLYTTGFRVQTEPSSWDAKVRRAGVSAFGFGGINAHVLVEEFKPGNKKHYFQPGEAKEQGQVPIAIVGMETITATADNLIDFKEQVLGGTRKTPIEPGSRWRIALSKENPLSSVKGFWINSVTTTPGEFHIPPNQIPDLLPQQLIMLKAAAGAIKDAGIALRPAGVELERTRFGAAIGIEFDYEATDFHLRWRNFNEEGRIKDALAPPLTANRTLGALGGIVASRIAREFKLGGPCFTVSAESASGMKAIDIGIDSLRAKETDIFLCGTVDMAGDLRKIILNHVLTPFSNRGETLSFDRNATGPVPSEGAGAIVLKTLEQAQKDGDRIYGIIKGTGSAGAGEMAHEASHLKEQMVERYNCSLEQSLADAKVTADSIGLYETHGSADPMEDAMELAALGGFDLHCALGSLKATSGDTGAATGLLSIIKTSLALFHHIIPPIPGFTAPGKKIESDTGIHIPRNPAYWVSEEKTLRRACVAAMTRDGGVSHVILEESVPEPGSFLSDRTRSERLNPLGNEETTLFVVKSSDRRELLSELERLKSLAATMILETDSCSLIGRAWYKLAKKDAGPTLSIIANRVDRLEELIKEAHNAVSTDKECSIKGFEGIVYTLDPMGERGKTAFLYPGSGNHFPGMGRGIGTLFPEILDALEEKGASLKKQVLPSLYYPQRISWEEGWEKDATARIKQHAHNMIYGQVFFGTLMTRVAETFGLRPDAGIGHSLGETASLFALRVWNDPNEMLTRMEASDLFTQKLAGKLTAAREVWKLDFDETPKWSVAAVNRSRKEVEEYLSNYDRLYILIVNTPNETVIGGSLDQVEDFIRKSGCGAMFLDGVVSVHCRVAEPCREEYLDLHRFECARPVGIEFYSCSRAISYQPSTEATAQSILDQAVKGFDYVKLINQAWQDGIRVFVEMGPGSSCTRAVKLILKKKKHLVLSLSENSGNDYEVLLKALADLSAHGIKLDLSRLYIKESTEHSKASLHQLKLATGRSIIDAALIKKLNGVESRPDLIKPDPAKPDSIPNSITAGPIKEQTQAAYTLEGLNHVMPATIAPETLEKESSPALLDSACLTALAHEAFLSLTQENMKAYEEQFAALAMAAAGITDLKELLPEPEPEYSFKPVFDQADTFKPLFDRNMCMEFATGSAGKVLGKEFEVIDTYPVRVRLPASPLMLVDRIMQIQGEMLSMTSGKIITQHDVLENAWYLDGGKAPVSITIEAGQADLFLCSFLGIDHKVKGSRRYRLLDAKVSFHRDLPKPGETIEYHIEIERFLKQGEIYLFFFHYKGYINDELLISMQDGCAGFFTLEEVANSGGIILKPEDREQIKPARPFVPPIKVSRESYSDEKIEALRHGDLESCFGPLFKGKLLAQNLRLPGGRMHLLDRVTSFDPNGGRFGLGSITAEADIRPNHWFLTCHFTDDMVMPGTLMYECCAHTLRIFTQRMGWIETKEDVHYDVIPGIESDLKCRGPVTIDTKKAGYEIEIKEMGYSPEPYVIADAHMFSDNHRIILYKNMGLKITGLSRQKIERIWS